jgi:hypothetical protein
MLTRYSRILIVTFLVLVAPTTWAEVCKGSVVPKLRVTTRMDDGLCSASKW